MASTTSEHVPTIPAEQANPAGSPDEGSPPESWFDRSSITADAMVTIEGASEPEWWRFAPENRICEFVDGVVYMPSPASDEHQDQVSFWFDLLNRFRLETGATLKVRLGPAVLKLAPGRNLEPDVFLIHHPPVVDAPPALLVVEVLSKSTHSHDLGLKTNLYRERGIPEIVHVDLLNRRLMVYQRSEQDYEFLVIERGAWTSSALPGFWLDLEWLWNHETVDPRACLQQILAGPPA